MLFLASPSLMPRKKHIFFNGIPVCKRCLNQADSTWDLVLDPDPLKYADPRIRDPRGKKSFALKT